MVPAIPKLVWVSSVRDSPVIFPYAAPKVSFKNWGVRVLGFGSFAGIGSLLVHQIVLSIPAPSPPWHSWIVLDLAWTLSRSLRRPRFCFEQCSLTVG